MPTDATDPDRPFPYLDFARRELLGWEGPLNLGMSGTHVPDDATCRAFGLEPPPFYPSAAGRLRQVLADRYALTREHVHLAAGTSHANFAACLGLARGGTMAVEQPVYEALPAIGKAIGATVRTFERRPEAAWALDPDTLRAAAHGADLIVVSNLHNPSGRRLTAADFALLDELAASEDAWVLVDEVYAAFDTERTHATAAARGHRYVTTNSLTKVWGFGDLRAGWILGQPDAIERIAAWDDLVNPMLVGASLDIAANVLADDEKLLADIRMRANARRDLVDAWVQRTPGVSWIRPDAGITGFVRIGSGPEADQGDRLAAAAADQHRVRVVPGSFFQRPAWIRISYDVGPDELEQALSVIGSLAESP